MSYLGNSPCCSLKLKPPKIPKGKSKKKYKDFFVREMKHFSHIYWLDGLYIVSVPKPIDGREWIDKNIDKIQTRKWVETDRYNYTVTLL